MIIFVSQPLVRILHYPCSNFFLSIAIQVSLSNLKFSTCISPNFSFNHTNGLFKVSKAEYACKSNNKLEAPWRILFFGTDEFAVKSLEQLCSKYRTQTLISRLEVVSSEIGKCSPVKQFVKDEKLILHNWPITTDLTSDNFDIGIVVSFGHLIPSKIINSFPLGMINVHGSILPRWRGAAPIVHAVLSGDNETGISIIRIRPKHFDKGEIVRQYRCSISPHETAKELHEKLSIVGGNLLIECIRDFPRCIQKATPQPEEGATYAKKIDSTYSIIDWNTMSSTRLYDMHRALGHIYPLLTQWHGTKVKLHNIELDNKKFRFHEIRTQASDTPQNEKANVSSALSFLSGKSPNPNQRQNQSLRFPPGTVIFDKPNKVLRIQCADGKFVLCSQITLSGRKKMTATDFNNGFIKKLKSSSNSKFTNINKELLSIENK